MDFSGRVGLIEGTVVGGFDFARGDFGTAWQYNPAAFLVMGFGALGVTRTMVGVTTRRWVNVSWTPGRVAYLAMLAGFFVLWAYQQHHAEFIINSRV